MMIQHTLAGVLSIVHTNMPALDKYAEMSLCSHVSSVILDTIIFYLHEINLNTKGYNGDHK